MRTIVLLSHNVYEDIDEINFLQCTFQSSISLRNDLHPPFADYRSFYKHFDPSVTTSITSIEYGPRVRYFLFLMDVLRKVRQFLGIEKEVELSGFQCKKLLHEFHTFYGLYLLQINCRSEPVSSIAFAPVVRLS